ncbi:hypothetical protein VL20_3627 [Microcystis panniformis FACHB-1757]|uniref:Uncharacterized protein n=1 Tax=Microcystis panniformis FACHB-1757 TaxID=1638788 RepID=A0A0K1S3L0_9CHRO|nr:hypothetical protein VL20_3627 [Microcystis panniformis FACHB-1757]
MSSEDAKPVNGSAIFEKTPVSRLSMNNTKSCLKGIGE